jgi:hypothetical protein
VGEVKILIENAFQLCRTGVDARAYIGSRLHFRVGTDNGDSRYDI